MWSSVVIEMQAREIAVSRRAEVAAARLSDAARRMAECAETERRIQRGSPLPRPAETLPAGM